VDFVFLFLFLERGKTADLVRPKKRRILFSFKDLWKQLLPKKKKVGRDQVLGEKGIIVCILF